MSRSGAIAAIAILASIVPGPVVAGSPQVYVVDDDGHGSPLDCDSARRAFTRIQAALDAVVPGDGSPEPSRVVVCPGTFRGRLVISSSNGPIWLQAATSVRPVVEPGPGEPQNATLIHVGTATRASITGFRIKPGGGPGAGCGGPGRTLIHVQFGDLVLVDSRLGPDAGEPSPCTRYGTGIRIEGDGGSPGFYGSARIYGSTVTGFGQTGVAFSGPSIVRIVGDSFRPDVDAANGTTTVAGIRFDQQPTLDGPGGLEISGNRFDAGAAPGAFTAITGSATAAVTISENRVTGATSGIRLAAPGGRIESNALTGRGADAAPGSGIVLHGAAGVVAYGNLATRFGTSGIRVVATTEAEIRGNDFRGNRGVDCVDTTSGGGDAGTANDWSADQGNESQPSGICT